MTILDKIFYSITCCGSALLALSVLCVIAWIRDSANDWRKDVP